MAKKTKKTATKKTASKKTPKTSSVAKKAEKKTTKKATKKPTKKATKKAAPRKSAATRKTTRKSASARVISAEERYHMIETAAYFRGEKDGFRSDASTYWVEAEKEIDQMLSGK
jgi:hypothetical protein